VHFKPNLQWYRILIILPANNMTAQLQNLWMFCYVSSHYSSVLLRTLHYYRPGLIILTRKYDVVVVNVFLTSTTVDLNHFAEGSQIQIYDFVWGLHKKIYLKLNDTFYFIELTKSFTQNIRCITERHCLSKEILSH